jgi:hypothetical protein
VYGKGILYFRAFLSFTLDTVFWKSMMQFGAICINIHLQSDLMGH